MSPPRAHSMIPLIAIPLIAIALTGCATPTAPTAPTAPAGGESSRAMDVSGEGWTTREGTAEWKLKADSKPAAGELLVALNPDGRRFVKFTRDSNTVVTVEIGPDGWRVDDSRKRRAARGTGALPADSLWLQFPGGLVGDQSTTNWYFARTPNDGWHFENLSTEETLDGVLVTTRLPRLHIVRPGENINRIARFHGVTAAAIRAANPGSGANWIHPGAVIQLPPLGAAP